LIKPESLKAIRALFQQRTREMKKWSIVISAVVTGVALLISCGEMDEGSTQVVALDLSTEVAMDVAYEDVDIITEAGIDLTMDLNTSTDASVLCSVVTHDQPNKTITIDFGNGCTDPRGRVREGKINIQYNDRRYVPGAYRIVTFDNFSINGIRVQGTRTLTNTSEEDQTPSFTIVLENGSLDFGDGTFATRESECTRVWYRGLMPSLDYVLITGSSAGINRNGAEYHVEIIQELRFNRNCIRFIPVSGTIEIATEGLNATVDFGDGTCDSIVTITINGKVIEKSIVPRGA
jgi:hypothetical protein